MRTVPRAILSNSRCLLFLGCLVAWMAPTSRAAAEPAEDGGVAPDGGSEASAEGLLEDANVQSEELTDVHVGTYVNRIRDINLHDGTFVVDFWVWFRWRGTIVRPHETFEVVNGEILSRQDGDVLNDLGLNYASVRVVATIFHIFDVRDFPYDDHRLEIAVEDKENEDHRIRYIPDVANTSIDPSVRVAGWNVRTQPPTVASWTYRTNYGFLSLGTNAESKYSRYVHHFELHRSSFMALFKLFWVSYLAVILALMALRVRVTDLDARFGLGVGAIFAASANTYVVNEILPDTDRITLAETVNLLAVGCIFMSLFVSIVSIRLTYRGKEAASERLDRTAIFVLAFVYLALNAYVLAR